MNSHALPQVCSALHEELRQHDDPIPSGVIMLLSATTEGWRDIRIAQSDDEGRPAEW